MELSRGGHVLGGALLVAGTAIGGGMLALPLATALGGFIPALVIYVLCWLFMTATALLLLEVVLWGKQEVNIISMAKMTLGKPGQIAAWILYLFLFYSLTIAYISGGGGLVEDVMEAFGQTDLPFWIGPLVFVLLFAPFVAFGAKAVDSINKLLMVGLILSFLVFVVLGISHIELNLLTRFNFPAAFAAMPIAFTSFSFQGLIPTLTTYLDRQEKKVRTAIVFGSLIPLLMYIIWEALFLGIVPLDDLLSAPTVISPLKEVINLPGLFVVGEFLAFFALVTSFLGVTLGLLDFLADGLKVKKTPKGRFNLSLLIYLPPLAFSMINPKVFLIALRFAGGLGCALLLGLLPILMVWRGRYSLNYKSVHKLFGGRITLTLLIIFVAFELFLMV